MEALSDEELAHRTVDVPGEGRSRGEPRRPPRRRLRHRARGGLADPRANATFDVQLMGGMALHFGWIAEMKTGEGKTLVSTLPVYLNALGGQGRAPGHGERLPGRRDAEWMGQVHRFLGLTVGRVSPELARLRGQARCLRLRHHLRDQHRVRLRLPARQHGPVPRAHGPAWPRLRHRRRGRLDPDRRGPHAAHHLGPGLGVGQALLPVRRSGPDARTRRGLRGRRGEADRRPHRGGHRQGGDARWAWTTCTTSCRSTTSIT